MALTTPRDLPALLAAWARLEILGLAADVILLAGRVVAGVREGRTTRAPRTLTPRQQREIDRLHRATWRAR